jgi:hypothetical protein
MQRFLKDGNAPGHTAQSKGFWGSMKATLLFLPRMMAWIILFTIFIISAAFFAMVMGFGLAYLILWGLLHLFTGFERTRHDWKTLKRDLRAIFTWFAERWKDIWV